MYNIHLSYLFFSLPSSAYFEEIKRKKALKTDPGAEIPCTAGVPDSVALEVPVHVQGVPSESRIPCGTRDIMYFHRGFHHRS